MVINIERLRSADFADVEDYIRALVAVAPVTVKVILENAYLDHAEKVAGCQAAARAGAAFVKTSTGFAPSGAFAEDIKLMRASVLSTVRVKPAGGVRTLDALLELANIGAARFGATATPPSWTTSRSVKSAWHYQSPHGLNAAAS